MATTAVAGTAVAAGMDTSAVGTDMIVAGIAVATEADIAEAMAVDTTAATEADTMAESHPVHLAAAGSTVAEVVVSTVVVASMVAADSTAVAGAIDKKFVQYLEFNGPGASASGLCLCGSLHAC